MGHMRAEMMMKLTHYLNIYNYHSILKSSLVYLGSNDFKRDHP